MLLEAVARLQDRRVRERLVDPDDPPVGAVVEAAIDPDWTVDPVDHPGPIACEAPKPLEVEVEGVVETGRRVAGEPVHLHAEPPGLQLPDEGQQELVPSSVRRRVELVEDGEVAPAPP